MAALRLPSSALWELVRFLSYKEFRRVKAQVTGTRLEWLLETLRHMESYSDASLYGAYKRAFPEGERNLLRVYKRQLWDVLEEGLSSGSSEMVGREVQLWQRLWLSVVLWQKGMREAAGALWHQAMHAAVEVGWYEIALWGVSLLEMYKRDFHEMIPEVDLTAWTQRLTQLIAQRYRAVVRKISALEMYYQSRSPSGWTLPSLPEEDKWSLYMESYALFLEGAYRGDFLEALERIIEMIFYLIRGVSFPPFYALFHLCIAYTNLGVFLMGNFQYEKYNSWYLLWERAWEKGYWPREERFAGIRRIVLATRMIYFLQTLQWGAARALWEKEKPNLERHVFQDMENINFRAHVACTIFLVLLLTPGVYPEAVRWRLRVEEWLEKEHFRDRGYLWWLFLRWYEAFRSGEKTWIRHWYRQLRKAWRQYFTQYQHWKPLFPILRGVTEGLPKSQQRKIRAILGSWEKNPSLKRPWDFDAVFFPMQLFVESLLRQVPLEKMPARLSSPALPLELEERLQEVLSSFENLISSSTA
ncbi:MAG: hypothetical protein N2170_07735 [Bacteroidia bacterium]|nr:hypothetical protein [Bacteroidia bacterium]